MKPFGYTRADSVAGAVTMLAEHPGARPLAGGTNLVDLMKLEVESPDQLIDVNRIGLDGVEETAEGGLLIGAGVRNSDLAEHPLVRRRYPVLSRALLAGASGQLRNMASVGGNLRQRTRCVYFMDPSKPCNKREPGSGCPAIPGLSRDLAILGTSEHCIASFPGDMSVALAALDATVHVETIEGPDEIPLRDFYRLPGDRPDLDTTLPPGALITAVELPAPAASAVSTYRKARDRRSYAFGLATVAAVLSVTDGVITDARIALGGVAHTPWRAERAERMLQGERPSVDLFARAASAELSAATPTEQNAFKVPLAERLMVGVLRELSGVDA